MFDVLIFEGGRNSLKLRVLNPMSGLCLVSKFTSTWRSESCEFDGYSANSEIWNTRSEVSNVDSMNANLVVV